MKKIKTAQHKRRLRLIITDQEIFRVETIRTVKKKRSRDFTAKDTENAKKEIF